MIEMQLARPVDKPDTKVRTLRKKVHYKTVLSIDRLSGIAEKRTCINICPNCGKKHVVNEAMQRVAYGKPYACSASCEIERRKASGSLW